MRDRLLRQSDLVPEHILGTKITIIGAGAIGSFTALSLSKMGFYNLNVMDFDSVSVENMCCQFYRVKDIGKTKVNALAEIIEDFTEGRIGTLLGKFDGTAAFDGIVIAAVDSMAVRKLIYDTYRHKSLGGSFLIDPRMGSESIQIHALKFGNKDAEEAYAKTLYTDDSAVAERCTAKATMYTVLSVSGAVVSVLKAYLTNRPYHATMFWDVPSNSMEGFKLQNSGS